MSDDRKARAMRERALDRPELRSDVYWNDARSVTPQPTRRCKVILSDARGEYEFKPDVIYNAGWFNADGRGAKRLVATVVKWRYSR